MLLFDRVHNPLYRRLLANLGGPCGLDGCGPGDRDLLRGCPVLMKFGFDPLSSRSRLKDDLSEIRSDKPDGTCIVGTK
jgi:hypothetical protein